MHLRRGATWLAAISYLAFGATPSAVLAETALESRLRSRIEAEALNGGLEVMDERIYARETIRQLYPERAYRPIWVDENGLLPRGESFRSWLATVPARHGLRPQDYHSAIIDTLDDNERLGAIADLEFATTDAFLMVGSHLLAGRLSPETLDPEWATDRRHRPLTPLLERAGLVDDPGAILEELLPVDQTYHALVQRLADLRQRRDAGGWLEITPGPALRAGDAGDRVEELIQRLVAFGDLDSAQTPAGFDEGVAQGVIRFQHRHGLDADAVVGRATQQALNVSVQRRIDQIIVNLERWRWLPEDLGDFYVLVNIAGFELEVIEDDEPILAMRVVVGQPYRRTPVFSGRISYLVLNPSWEVPPSIAVKDKLPLIKADPGYLGMQGYDLLQGWGDQEQPIDPATVDWTAVTARSFPYRLRQRPGAFNALGAVKFMFPNKFSVYLHDTPSRELFKMGARAFSSGCIRLEAPLDLAELLLNDRRTWSRDAIEGAIGLGTEQTVRLTRQVPVHLMYWTAWIDRVDGQLNFRDDVYGRDETVLRELRELPPN